MTGPDPHRDVTMAEINVTPFTDVLLVLLIVFMLLATLSVAPGFEKKNAKPCEGCDRGQTRTPIVVEVGSSDRIAVDDAVVASDGIYGAMAAAIARHASDPRRLSTHIELIGDTSAPYATIVRVLDAGREAGDDDVGLVTR